MENDQALFALERRFELRSLYIYNSAFLAILTFGVINFDWQLAGICVVAFILNGLIGQGLGKNRFKSFSQIAAAETSSLAEPSNVEFRKVYPSFAKFIVLMFLSGGVLAYHFNQPWRTIIAAGAAGCLISLVLIFASMWRGRW